MSQYSALYFTARYNPNKVDCTAVSIEIEGYPSTNQFSLGGSRRSTTQNVYDRQSGGLAHAISLVLMRRDESEEPPSCSRYEMNPAVERKGVRAACGARRGDGDEAEYRGVVLALQLSV